MDLVVVVVVVVVVDVVVDVAIAAQRRPPQLLRTAKVGSMQRAVVRLRINKKWATKVS